MKKKGILAITLSLLGVAAMATISAVSFAYYEKIVKIVDENEDNIPVSTGEPRDTRLYLYPGYSQGWGGLLSVKNLYLACCMYKNDDSQYKWEFVKVADETTAQIQAADDPDDRIIEYSTGNQTFKMMQYDLDLTYYDRFAFMRIQSTKNLLGYMGIAVSDDNAAMNTALAPTYFECTNLDNNAIPLDWRNINSANKCYDATHRLSKQKDKNVYEVKATNSPGAYGFLSRGDWWDFSI